MLEQADLVGGLARTEAYKGYCFDIGGHRFFTRVAHVQRFWQDVLGDDFVKRRRLSRIYYQSTFFNYPIDPINALIGLGPFEAIRCVASYVGARLFPPAQQDNLEQWLIAKFGSRLYQTFFKTYTEKVWGVPCQKIGADWAAQRIRGLSMSSMLKNVFSRWFSPKSSVPKSLIQEFDYPRKGPGMMWNRTREIIVEQGSEVRMNSAVEKIVWKPGSVEGVYVNGEYVTGSHFVSSMPIRDLLQRMDPEPPGFVRDICDDFQYRDFITVALMVRGKNLFPDNWIYVHDPSVKVGRIQNYNNWSSDMVADPDATCLGLEYFCFEGDELWQKSDEELFEQAKREASALGLIGNAEVFDGKVLRVPKAYPVYNDRYQAALGQVRGFLGELPNLQLIGRNGMHRYNNQDHSVLTGMLAARNILGLGPFDLWQVNADSDYHEDGFRLTQEEVKNLDATQPLVPKPIPPASETGRSRKAKAGYSYNRSSAGD